MATVLLECLGEGQVVVIAPRSFTCEELRERAKTASGSFGESLADRVWAGLFRSGRDLREEYSEFYSADYSSLGAFLYWKHNLDNDVIEQIIAAPDDSTTVLFVDGSLDAGYGFMDWLFEDDGGWPIAKQLLDAKRMTEDEDTD